MDGTGQRLRRRGIEGRTGAPESRVRSPLPLHSLFPDVLLTCSYTPKLVDEQRLRDCVDLLLTMQNPDGGFASYELVRGNKRLEWLNTAEVFGKSVAVEPLTGLTDSGRGYHDRVYVSRVNIKPMDIATLS